ncbi:uncharacterized protein YukE [Paenibacillus shirakamiensis]|uniref:Uncharacterized protein YukE n=1 Tax=Paenibacillus shirakamiensis TaxID=1265935 RepID=A0ABS4JIN6_9BACL|nr:hypothetical protein [Paenibacillus shirakamiensis]MBP2001001.1 uncharacterized protein YukE [Paenibacillus shirakamiensis]
MRIRVEPEQLRNLSKNLQHSAEQLRQITAYLNQSMALLLQENAAQGPIADQWQQAQLLSEHLLSELHRLGITADTKADAFQALENEIPSSRVKTNDKVGVNASALFVGLGALRRVIIPGKYLMHDAISDPKSAVIAVHTEKSGYIRPRWEQKANDREVSTLLGNVQEEPSSSTAIINLMIGKRLPDGRRVLEEAVNNPNGWKFMNPSSSLRESLRLRRIPAEGAGKMHSHIKLSELREKLRSKPI